MVRRKTRGEGLVLRDDRMKRIGYVCESGDTFIEPIMARLPYETAKLMSWPPPEIPDLLWIEWCDTAAVNITKMPRFAPTIVRLHSYEAFVGWPGQVDWRKVDALVFVAEHVRDWVKEAHGIPDDVRTVIIPNGLDFERFYPTPTFLHGCACGWTESVSCRGLTAEVCPECGKDILDRLNFAPPLPPRGKKIAWVGSVSHKKGPELFAQVCKAVLEYDPGYEFHVVGALQDPRYAAYFNHMLPDEVVYHEELPAEEMPDFFRGMDFVLSTSPWESFQYAVAEGIACGCIPLVHDWPGAAATCPQALIWDTIDALVFGLHCLRDIDLEPLSRASIADLKARHDIEDTTERVRDLVATVMEDGFPRPSIAACMIVKGNEPRFRAALESIHGHVDEIVALIDTRSGEQNVEVAEQFGCRVFPGEPILWGGDLDFTGCDRPKGLSRAEWKMVLEHQIGEIDFSANRNRAFDLAESEWALVLDADEVFVGDHATKLRAVAADAALNGHDGAACHINCYTNTGKAEEGADVRLMKNDGTIRYRYPIHNQLRGIKSATKTDLAIDSTYVGGMDTRFKRSVPPLLKFWAQATTDDEREHAAFFLARMHAAQNKHREVCKWSRICRKMCPGTAQAAPFWRWYAFSLATVRGKKWLEVVAKKGLAIHPTHPDLLHAMLTVTGSKWHDACANPMNFAGVPMGTRMHVGAWPEAVKLLGLPIQMERKRI